MIEREVKIAFKEYAFDEEFNDSDKQLISLAKNAAQKAYAPYSNFKVGASVLLQNGESFTGNNQENAAYPSGLCAERVVIFYANANFPNERVLTIAICAINQNGLVKNPIPPCGSCRQVLLEAELRFNFPIRIILIGSEKLYLIEGITNLLPLHFTKSFLNS